MRARYMKGSTSLSDTRPLGREMLAEFGMTRHLMWQV